MKIQRVFSSTVIMIAVLSLACAALAISWPEWREDLTAEGYYGYGYGYSFFLPDTGQTKCYREVDPYDEIPCAGTGQDGAYDINPMSFTDNEDGTVTDNNTGLMWQKCSAGQNNDSTCSGTAGTYNWYQASGTYDADYNLTSQDVCGELTTGNYSDWRLPTKKELITIVDYSVPALGPTISESHFPNTISFMYFSSTIYADHLWAFDKYVWGVHFDTGYVFGSDKSDGYYVRCVRGDETPASFTDNLDGTVTDNRTGLMWQQDEPGSMTWADALNYCEALELPLGSGQRDWRLPNIKELESITDDSHMGPAIDTTYFPYVYASYHGYWSSTTYAYSPGYVWTVNFYTGSVNYGNGNFRSRCVRGSTDYYCDDDSDGYIDSQIDGTCVGDGCVFEGCQITPGDDCNDNDDVISPGATEICDDGIDNNCDGQIDEGCSFPLAVTKAGTGSGTVTSNPVGINCGSDCSETYDTDTVVTLTAAPDTGSAFTGWSGDSDCSDGQVTMNADKACIANFTKTRFQETDPAISYTGKWNTYLCPSCSGGAVKYSNNQLNLISPANAVLSFNGTGIKWVAAKANMLGKAKVYLDGRYMGLIDLYSAAPQYQVVLFQKTGLTPGAHSIAIHLLGQKNLRSKGYHIDIDAFEVIP